MINPSKQTTKSDFELLRTAELRNFACAGLAVAMLLPAHFAFAAVSKPAEPQEGSLTVEQARRIVAPLYDALNEPSKKDVSALLAKATNADYKSCSTNQDCLDRDHLAAQFKAFGAVIPNLHWAILDVRVSGDAITVRGEATGTPVAALFGVSPTGRSFKTISLDLFTVKNGRLETAYHVENWTAAMEQIKTP
jgi:predicted ester cyclase